MKSSLVITTFNEEASIKRLLDSITKQTLLPSEVIVVDAQSIDKTAEIVRSFKIENPRISVLLIEYEGNRASGRNEGIRQAAHEIILVTDAGCELKNSWVQEITKPFADKNVEVVAGYYKPVTNTVFEDCLASYTSVMDDRIDPENFLPSSRSVAFKKNAWKEVGGYPEEFDTCEDLIFARRLKKNGFKFKFAKNALVYWPQRRNLFLAFKQFFGYAVGDGQALYVRRQTPFLFLRYILGLFIIYSITQTGNFGFLWVFVIGFTFYILWAVWKNYKYVKKLKAFFWLPILQFTADIAVMSGMVRGLVKRYAKI